MAVMATYICTAFQFNQTFWHTFHLNALLPFSLSKCITVHQWAHLNKECVTYHISLNVHRKCTWVLSLWWIWPIIWLYRKTSPQGLLQRNRKEHRRWGTERADGGNSAGHREGVVLLIKKEGRRFSPKMRKEKREKQLYLHRMVWFASIYGHNGGKIIWTLGLKLGWIEKKSSWIKWQIWTGIRNGILEMALEMWGKRSHFKRVDCSVTQRSLGYIFI